MDTPLYVEHLSIHGTIKSSPQPGGGRNLYLSNRTLGLPRTSGIFAGQKRQYLGLHGGLYHFTLSYPSRIQDMWQLREYMPSIKWITHLSNQLDVSGGARLYIPLGVTEDVFATPPRTLLSHKIRIYGMRITRTTPPVACPLPEANFIAGKLTP